MMHARRGGAVKELSFTWQVFFLSLSVEVCTFHVVISYLGRVTTRFLIANRLGIWLASEGWGL